MRSVDRKRGERGLTLVELIVAFTILSLLTTMAVPLARYKVRIEQEKELRYALRTITKAIDDYKDASNAQKIEVKLGTDGYPETLEQLVMHSTPDIKREAVTRLIFISSLQCG